MYSTIHITGISQHVLARSLTNKYPQNMTEIGSNMNQVISVWLFQLHVLEAELTDPQLGLLAILLRIWREIPSVNLILADLHLVYVLHLCYLFNQSINQSIGTVTHSYYKINSRLGKNKLPQMMSEYDFLTRILTHWQK